MTETEKMLAVARTAQAAGRRVAVVTASKDGKSADLVGIVMVDEILRDPSNTFVISLPRRDAQLLLKDLDQALNGKLQSLEDALKDLAEKGPKA